MLSEFSSVRPCPDVVSSSDAYAERFRGGIGKWLIDVQNRALLRLLRPWPGATILDVGGGHGQYTRELADHGYKVTVLGSAPETARRIADLVDGGRCAFAVGDFLQLPFPDQSFDVVVSTRQVAHMEESEAFLSELGRVSRNAVIIDFPPSRSFNVLQRLLFPLKLKLEKNSTRPFKVFSERDLERIFSARHFEVTGREPLFCLPMVLHRTVRWVGLMRFLEGILGKLGVTRRMGSPVLLRVERYEPESAAGAAPPIHGA